MSIFSKYSLHLISPLISFTTESKVRPPLLCRGGAEVGLGLEEGSHLQERGGDFQPEKNVSDSGVRGQSLAGLWGAWGREGDDSGKRVAASCEGLECPSKKHGFLLA